MMKVSAKRRGQCGKKMKVPSKTVLCFYVTLVQNNVIIG